MVACEVQYTYPKAAYGSIVVDVDDIKFAEDAALDRLVLELPDNVNMDYVEIETVRVLN